MVQLRILRRRIILDHPGGSLQSQGPYEREVRGSESEKERE